MIGAFFRELCLILINANKPFYFYGYDSSLFKTNIYHGYNSESIFAQWDIICKPQKLLREGNAHTKRLSFIASRRPAFRLPNQLGEFRLGWTVSFFGQLPLWTFFGKVERGGGSQVRSCDRFLLVRWRPLLHRAIPRNQSYLMTNK